MPVVSRSAEVFGGLFFGHPEVGRFTESHERIVVGIAAQAAVAIENARLYAAVRDSEAKARAAERRKDEFLAMLGHELRNPLAPIVTALQLMKSRPQDAAGDRARAVIERQVEHLSRLVDDLLDVARITRGKIDLKRQAVQACTLVGKAIELASPLLERRCHSLELDVPREGLTLYVDPTRMAQVLANLLTNAAKYTDPGGRIFVGARARGAQVAFCVRDNGIGIRKELLPHLFDLFVQGDRTIDRGDGGLGLGLTLVHSLVTLHAGRVEARSDGPGCGSEFVVYIPMADAGAVREAPAGRVSVPRGLAGATRRVLVVDDNTDAADTLAEALRLWGHDVRVAHDGPSALELVAGFPPEVALLDIGLPVMDGYELAERLRGLAAGRPLRLVAITGYGQESDRLRARAAGFDEHMVKPIDLTQLETAVGADRERGASAPS